jgi:CheY-like chemotaxis protein
MDGFEVVHRYKLAPKLAGTTIMILSSADSDSDASRCRGLGIARYLRKPVTTPVLHEAILVALGRIPAKKSIKRPITANNATPVQRLNILLAEDNVVNQLLAVSILERRGHAVQPVNNGKEALDAMACERFDLVLMDVQMPEMDGLEATVAIRRMEQDTGRHIPIIAMTAHAMKGDCELCLDSGMDDYLAKPVEPKTMRDVVERWGALAKKDALPAERTNSGEPASPARPMVDTKTAGQHRLPIEEDIFDFSALRARVEDDLELLAEMIDLYLSSSPLLLNEIEQAVAAHDGNKISRVAHTLKGLLKNMCATACAEAAFQLETIGRTGSVERANQSLATLKIEFQRFQSVLAEVAKGVQT